jgi:hypothetical protein
VISFFYSLFPGSSIGPERPCSHLDYFQIADHPGLNGEIRVSRH